jgi:hypothetical protein
VRRLRSELTRGASLRQPRLPTSQSQLFSFAQTFLPRSHGDVANGHTVMNSSILSETLCFCIIENGPPSDIFRHYVHELRHPPRKPKVLSNQGAIGWQKVTFRTTQHRTEPPSRYCNPIFSILLTPLLSFRASDRHKIVAVPTWTLFEATFTMLVAGTGELHGNHWKRCGAG